MAFILDGLMSDHESYEFDTNILDVRKYTYSYFYCIDEYCTHVHQSHILSIYVFISACSVDSIDGSICGFVTLTTQVTTSLPTDGLRDIIGNEIGSFTESQEFIDGLYNEVDSCDGTVDPGVFQFQHTFDIEYSISCIEDYLEEEMKVALEDTLFEHQSYEVDAAVEENGE